MPTPFFSGAPALVPAPCPPNAATPPHTPAAHPAYTLHPRSLRPSSLHPAGNSDSTMQSLHSAITAPCNHLLRSTRQLPNSPSLRLPNKSKSRQVEKPTNRKVGERTAPWIYRPPELAPPTTKDGGAPAYRSSSSHPAGKPHPPARSPPYPPGRPNKRGLPRLTPSKMYNAIVSGRCPAQTAPVPQAIKGSVRSLQREHVP